MDWHDWIETKRGAYRRLFQNGDGDVGPDAQIVLADLKRFCYVDQSTLKVSPITRTVDTHATMLAEGRREVWMRIQAHLRLSERQVSDLQEKNDE